MPVPAVEPDDVALVLAVAGEPVDSGGFAAVAGTHEDEALAFEGLLHHFELVVGGHQDFGVHVVLAHLLHHRLDQVAETAGAFVLLELLSVLVFACAIVRSPRRRHIIIIAPTLRSK